MTRTHTVADRLRSVIDALGLDLPVAFAGWDGSRSGAKDGPTLVVRHPRALRRLVWQPNQLGLGRAWVADERPARPGPGQPLKIRRPRN